MGAQKIVITGAPSSGKTSALGAIQRLGWPGVAIVPEAAVVLLGGGYPAPAHDDLEQIREFQRIILEVQASLEITVAQKNPAAASLLLDRAKLDGAGFWPPGPEDYLRIFHLDLSRELAAYDEVIFLEMPSEAHFGGVHQTRFHDYAQSAESGRRLERIWSQHSNFTKIPAAPELATKIEHVIQAVKARLRPRP